jgi:hypothetical protein
MKTLTLILGLLSAFVFTGASCRIGKDGASVTPVTPPPDSVVRITVRSIGVSVGQNQATQTPEAQIGYKSATYDRVPTSTNPVYAAPVKADIGVTGEGFGARITENFQTGAAITEVERNALRRVMDAQK